MIVKINEPIKCMCLTIEEANIKLNAFSRK